ncbi:hypothetical protein PP16_gp01 [Pectobacterium phage PP16]|uniref:Uncharacterized protein n=1 Tax=Pectobacterium phage PP16 TaxID=1873958 RepID=A0A1B1PEA0_9CAUD|nr:hypothetical protein PP16_gp01 [Pectobacterium phage PP16]ANT45302.1 hypothetical protein PP16_gp01 [Pectobacterium phage PP16]
MGYAKKLQRRFEGLDKLSGGTLQKRRDKLNQAGIHREKQRATFSTHVKGKEKRKGCGSKPPRGW